MADREDRDRARRRFDKSRISNPVPVRWTSTGATATGLPPATGSSPASRKTAGGRAARVRGEAGCLTIILPRPVGLVKRPGTAPARMKASARAAATAPTTAS